MIVKLSPAELATADQIHATMNTALDGAVALCRGHMATEGLSAEVATASMTLYLRGHLGSDSEGWAGMLAAAIVRLAIAEDRVAEVNEP